MADRILRIRYGDNVSAEKRFKSVVTYLQQLIEDGLRDEYVRRKAVSIVDRAGVKGHDELGEIRAIVKWVQNNVVYRKDPMNVEYFMSARRLLKDVEEGRSAAQRQHKGPPPQASLPTIKEEEPQKYQLEP